MYIIFLSHTIATNKSYQNLHPYVHSSISYNSQDMEAT